MKVFLSHAQNDKTLARQAEAALTQAGLEVWSDDQILPGDNWAAKHAEALDNAEAMVVLLSAAALQSQEVMADLSFALGQRGYKGRLVPVVTSPKDVQGSLEIPWILKRMDTVELGAFNHPEEAFSSVAQRLKASLDL